MLDICTTLSCILMMELVTAADVPDDTIEPSTNLEFDPNDPIASHSEMISIVTDIYERNLRRGLSDPNVLTNADRQAILDLHNQIRSELARGIYEGPGGFFQPPGCDINALSWSSALEEVATANSDKCFYDSAQEYTDCVAEMNNLGLTGDNVEWNRQNTDECGENLYANSAPAAAMDYWHNGKNYGLLGGIGRKWTGESKEWTYNNLHFLGGHFTQFSQFHAVSVPLRVVSFYVDHTHFHFDFVSILHSQDNLGQNALCRMWIQVLSKRPDT